MKKRQNCKALLGPKLVKAGIQIDRAFTPVPTHPKHHHLYSSFMSFFLKGVHLSRNLNYDFHRLLHVGGTNKSPRLSQTDDLMGTFIWQSWDPMNFTLRREVKPKITFSSQKDIKESYLAAEQSREWRERENPFLRSYSNKLALKGFWSFKPPPHTHTSRWPQKSQAVNFAEMNLVGTAHGCFRKEKTIFNAGKNFYLLFQRTLAIVSQEKELPIKNSVKQKA